MPWQQGVKTMAMASQDRIPAKAGQSMTNRRSYGVCVHGQERRCQVRQADLLIPGGVQADHHTFSAPPAT